MGGLYLLKIGHTNTPVKGHLNTVNPDCQRNLFHRLRSREINLGFRTERLKLSEVGHLQKSMWTSHAPGSF